MAKVRVTHHKKGGTTYALTIKGNGRVEKAAGIAGAFFGTVARVAKAAVDAGVEAAKAETTDAE